MPRRFPGYCRHKASNLAYVRWKPLFGNKPHYLKGAYDSPESWEEYNAILKEIKISAAANEPAPTPVSNPSISRVCGDYLLHVEKHDPNHYSGIKSAVVFLEAEYGLTQARDFGSLKLEELRAKMLSDTTWSRRYINDQVGRIKRMFKWACTRQYFPLEVFGLLNLVEGLRKGHPGTHDRPKVKPVKWSDVELILPHMNSTVRAMLDVQSLTGMRSAEITTLNVAEVDRTVDPWLYKPEKHKTAIHDKEKLIFFGPKAQEILRPFIERAQHYVFTPADSIEEHNARRSAERKTKLYGRAKNRKPVKRYTRERYTSKSYQLAIVHGFVRYARSLGHTEQLTETVMKNGKKKRRFKMKVRAWLRSKGITFWHPHQLRHARATDTREIYGIEGTRAQLGNTFQAAMIYAEESAKLAARIASETG